jgi:uncharacterized membrane protein YjjP (DUF1212 family)
MAGRRWPWLSFGSLGIVHAFDFMNTPKINLTSKLIALILISIGLALLSAHIRASEIARLDSMSPSDFLDYYRKHHGAHSFIFNYFSFLVVGGIFVAIVELFAYVIRLVIPKNTDAS